MCAVIGYVGPGGPRAAAKLVSLFEQSKIRGLHAFGFAYLDGTEVVCERFLQLDEARAYLAAIAQTPRPLKLIAHCRYSTSGDWRLLESNQPLLIDNVAMAFNGVIRMSTKELWGAEFGFTPVTDNDGEIFLRKVLDGDDWADWVAHGSFSFAGVMLCEGQLLALRNRQRPLYHVRDSGAHYVGSTQDIFRRAGFRQPAAIKPGEIFHVGRLR